MDFKDTDKCKCGHSWTLHKSTNPSAPDDTPCRGTMTRPNPPDKCPCGAFAISDSN